MSEAGDDSDKKHDRRLNDLIAVTVVILTVFLAVSKVKDDNIVQAMQKAQSTAVDAWAEYQSTRVKLHVDENGLAMLRLLESSGSIDKALAAKQAAEYEADIKKYEARSKETRTKAEELEKEYTRLNLRDDQFDISDALISIAIAVAAVAAAPTTASSSSRSRRSASRMDLPKSSFPTTQQKLSRPRILHRNLTRRLRCVQTRWFIVRHSPQHAVQRVRQSRTVTS